MHNIWQLILLFILLAAFIALVGWRFGPRLGMSDHEAKEMVRQVLWFCKTYRHKEGTLPDGTQYHVFTADGGRTWRNARWTESGDCELLDCPSATLLGQIPGLDEPDEPPNGQINQGSLQFLRDCYRTVDGQGILFGHFQIFTPDDGAHWYNAETVFDDEMNYVGETITGPADPKTVAFYRASDEAWKITQRYGSLDRYNPKHQQILRDMGFTVQKDEEEPHE